MQENEIQTDELFGSENAEAADCTGDEPADNDPAEGDEDKLYTQSQLDELIETERGEFAKKLAEAEKLAAMSEAERSDYRRGQLDAELAEREAAVAKRELMADAYEMLEKAGLPKQLAVCLDYSDQKACERSFGTVSRAFESAVSSAVNERVRGKAPKLSAGGPADAFLAGLGVQTTN